MQTHEPFPSTRPLRPFTSRPTRILLVDDDSDLRGFVAEELRESGWEVVEVDNGRDALVAVNESLLDEPRNWFDLVVADQKMPHLTGLQLLERLRTTGLPTPFVLMTGFRDGDLRMRADELGAWAVLQKPIDMRALHAAVRDAI